MSCPGGHSVTDVLSSIACSKTVYEKYNDE